MKKTEKIVLGLFTILFVLASLPVSQHLLSLNSESLFEFRVYQISLIVSLTVGIFYLTSIVSNDKITSNKRTLWVIALFFLPDITVALYWYYHIWRGAEAKRKPVSKGQG